VCLLKNITLKEDIVVKMDVNIVRMDITKKQEKSKNKYHDKKNFNNRFYNAIHFLC